MTTMDDKIVSEGVTESASRTSPMAAASGMPSEESAIPGIEEDSGMAHISCSNELLEETGNTEEDPMPQASVFSMRDRCWLCQCLRKDEENDEDDDDNDDDDDICLTRTKDGALQEFLPWLCKTCEKTMEEEERKAEPAPLTDDDLTDGVTSPTCNCESCTKAREVELEQEKLAKELEQCWLELSQVVRCIYHMSSVSTGGSASSSPCRQSASPSTVNNVNRAGSEPDGTELQPTDIERMKDYVCRLCVQDADQLYQRLESQVREVVIEMKVKLLKELSVDLKIATRAHQFVALLLEQYLRLCASSQQATAFLSIFEEQHLRQFNLTWQLHNKHLFHSVIFSDPVVQNCLPKVIAHLRASLSSDDCVEFVVQYNRTLADFQRFETEMSVIGTVWKECKRLIEQYNEAQAALRLKQKMFKEDWAFFKAQRRLLEQAMPKNKMASSGGSSQCCFDVQFNEMMKNILQGKKSDDYQCPACKQPRCPCDECNISHMITCGIISPDVTDQIPTHHHPHPMPLHHPPHPTHPKPRDPRPGGEGSSPPPLPPPLAFPRYYANVKPPSMPSSSSSSRSESPIVIDRYRFFADNFDFNDITGVDNDCDYFDIDNNTDKGDAMLPLATTAGAATRHKSTTTEAGNSFDSIGDDELDEASPLKEARPSTSSLVARMMMASVNLSGDKATCTCPHCLMNNGTLCMFESARRRLNEPKPAVDRLQLSQFGMSRRLLNPQLYELHDDLSPTRDDDDDDDMTGNSAGNEKNSDGDEPRESASFESFGTPSIWSSEAAGENDPAAGAWPESHKPDAPAAEKPHDLNPLASSPAVVEDGVDLKPVGSNVNGSENGETVIKMETGANAAGPTVKSPTEVPSTKATSGSQTSACCVAKATVAATVTPPVTSADLSPSKAKRCLGNATTPVSKIDVKHTAPACAAAAAAKSAASATPCTATRRSQSACLAAAAAQVPSCKEPCRSQSTPTQCKAANAAAAVPKLPSSMANSGAAMKLLADAVSRTKLAAAGPQCAHDDTTHTTATAAPTATDNSAASSGCTGDKSGRGSAAGGAGQKDGGKFCECWHCEFFGHVPSTLPLSRNYAEIRDRLRLRLQKKKERKSPGGGGPAGLSVTCSDQSPSGSPRPDLPTPPAMLNDKEVEEIIRFINGVDEVMNASQGAVTANAATPGITNSAKQKTKAKRKVPVRDGSRPVVDGSKSLADVSKKDEPGPGSPSKVSSTHAMTPPQCQAMKISKTDFAAELSSQLAALRDAATRYGVTLQTDTASTGSNSSALPTPPAKCRKQQHPTGSRTGTPSGQKLPSAQVAASPTGKDGAMEITAKRAVAQRTDTQTSSSPARQQQLRVEGSACKGKRQKAERHDDTAPFDDIFLPSDEVNGRTESDDFDREIEEFKRFCYNSWLMQKRERQRVTLNLKDIFARKKSHQGCTS